MVPRIFGLDKENSLPRIDRDAVEAFFELRAKKAASLGELSTVIYQDKNPDLALRRDRAEKQLLKEKIAPFPGAKVLDLGCGNGRWAGPILAAGCCYYGVDSSSGLIELARRRFANEPNAYFSISSIEDNVLEAFDVRGGAFNRILMFGVLIYMNDDDVAKTLKQLPLLSQDRARIILREPVGVEKRLTIKDHFSTDMDQTYNAIYRTETELMKQIEDHLLPNGFRSVGQGDVFLDPALNNRSETRQRWFVFER